MNCVSNMSRISQETTDNIYYYGMVKSNIAAKCTLQINKSVKLRKITITILLEQYVKNVEPETVP